MRHRWWALCSALGLMAPSAWAQIPLGSEFPVNGYTTDAQDLPAVAADSAGNFVVVWQSYWQDGSQQGIFARKYTRSGTPVGSSEFRVNAYTTSRQDRPAVASDPTGHFVVVWQNDGQDSGNNGISGRRFDPSGIPGPEFGVNTYTTGFQGWPSVAMDAAGNFVVAWESDGQINVYGSIFAQRYDAAGAPQGSEFRVDTVATYQQTRPSVGMDAAGDFVIVWDAIRASDGGNYGVFARRYNAAGVAQGGELHVNSYTTLNQYQSSVAMAADGHFVVVWASFGQDGSDFGVFGQRFDASGARQGTEFRVNEYTLASQSKPKVSMHGDGDFVVVWDSVGQDGSSSGVFSRVFTASGVPEGHEFQVNTATYEVQSTPVVATQPGGQFAVAWIGSSVSGGEIFGRRFAKDFIFQDGFEAGDLSKWSSSATDSGDLFPSVFGAMKSSSVGVEGVVDDTASLFVQDDTPIDENRYRARFYVDTNGFDPGEASNAHRTRVFIAFEEAPTRRLAAVVLKRQGGAYSIEGRCRLDSGAQADTGFFAISDGPHAVEIDWKRSSSAVANDGTFELWIDGVSRSQLTGLDNSVSSVDFVRMGALSVKAGATGTLYWDEFVSRRINAIGN